MQLTGKISLEFDFISSRIYNMALRLIIIIKKANGHNQGRGPWHNTIMSK